MILVLVVNDTHCHLPVLLPLNLYLYLYTLWTYMCLYVHQGCPLGPPKSVSISTHQKRRCVGVVGLAAPAAGWSLRPA
jgi:hypothetical protein